MDFAEEQLCWSDGGAKMTSKRPKIPPKIECMDLNGGNRRPVINFDENQHPYGVTLTKNHVYWTDWKK